MRTVDGHRLGIWSLRIDAIYCALLGAAVALGAAPIATVIALPHPLIVAAGVAVVVWSVSVLWMLARLRITTALRLVMGVNVVAALLIGLCVTVSGTLLAVIAVLAVAVDVALFAVSQALALRTLPVARVA